MSKVKLSDVATVIISNVDKKIIKNEINVKLCNYTDVYKNWAITSDMVSDFMDATAKQQEIDKFKLEKGMVAITKDSETKDDIGISTYISDNLQNTILGYHCALIIPNQDKLNGKYLNVLLHSQYAKKYFELNAGGSGQRYSLSIDDINNFKFELPTLEKQEKIGNLFSALDMKIQNNIKTNLIAEEVLSFLYDYWFTQYDFLDTEHKNYKSDGGSFIWNEKIKKNIPEKWTIGKIRDLCSVNSGFPFKTESYSNDGIYKLITIKNVQDSGINLNVDNYIMQIPENLPDYCKLKKKDILMSLTGNVGRVGLMYDDYSLLNQRVAVIKPRNEKINSFLYCFFKSQAVRLTVEKISGGTSQKNLSPIETEELDIPYSIKVIEEFSKIADPMIDIIVSNLSENHKIIEMRNYLLLLFLTDQITIN